MWEDILKRRPLKINKPGEDDDASLNDIKNKIEEFIIKVEIMDRYVIDLGKANSRGEDLGLNLENYFDDTPLRLKAEYKTGVIREKVQNGEISLLNQLRALKSTFGILRKKFLLREDLIASANIVEEIDNILSRDMYVLIDQARPFRAKQRGRNDTPSPDNPTYPPLPDNPW